jgi:hypothetical protein
MFNKKPAPQFTPKLTQRINKIATPDLMLWVEQALNETNRTVQAYAKSSSPENLNDMLLGAEAIHALVAELSKRTVV